MELFNKLCLCLCVLFFLWNINKVFGATIVITPNNREAKIQKELQEILIKPTPWNYYFTTMPSPQTCYLNGYVDATIVIVDKKIFTIDKALAFSIPMYIDFMRKLNGARIMRPFLSEFPITPKNCSLGIRFNQTNRENIQEPYISCFGLHNGASVEFTDPKEKLVRYGFAHRKYYELDQFPELLALCSKGVLRRSLVKKPVIEPLKELPYCSEKTAHYSFFEFLKKWTLPYSLKVIIMGTTDELKTKTYDFSFALFGTQNLLLDKARTVAATCAKDSLHFMKTDPSCPKCFEEMRAKDPNVHPSPEHIAFRIAFWDENVDRVVQPYIAEVRFVDCVFKYYMADEEQRLVLVHQETFDEAMQFLDQAAELSSENQRNLNTSSRSFLPNPQD